MTLLRFIFVFEYRLEELELVGHGMEKVKQKYSFAT